MKSFKEKVTAKYEEFTPCKISFGERKITNSNK